MSLARNRTISNPLSWVVLASAALIVAARRPEQWTNPQFWAEDGYFYGDAYGSGWRALFHPYAGYFHTAARLVAQFSLLFDPASVPLVFTVCATALTLLVCAEALSPRNPIGARCACALAVVLIPDAFEILGTVASIQFVLAGGLFLVLIRDDGGTRREVFRDAVATAFFSLSGGAGLLTAPGFAWRAWNRKTRASAILLAVSVLCAAIQGTAILTHPWAVQEAPTEYRYLLPVIGLRLTGSLLGGSFLPAKVWHTVAVGLGLATLAAVGWLGLSRGERRRCLGPMTLAWGVLLAGSLYRIHGVLHSALQPGFGARYFFPLQMAMVWLVLARLTGAWKPVATVILAWILIANIPRYREPTFGDFHWKTYAAKLRAGEAVAAPMSPTGWLEYFPARPHSR